MEARYEVDEATKLLVIKITDAASGEVLRQYPNEAAV